MAFGVPQDDDQPQYDPLAQLLSGYNPNADHAGPQLPQQTPTAMQTVAPAQAQPQAPTLPVGVASAETLAAQQQQQQAQPQQAPQTPRPAVVLPTAPTAPTTDMDKYTALEGAVSKFAKPTDRNDPAVKPRWWDRLAGAAVGFGAAYHGDVRGGIEAGSNITNRRYDQAEAARQGQEQAAKQDLEGFEHRGDLARRDYESQIKGFDANMQTARATQEQNNNDRTFGEGQRVSDRNYNREVMTGDRDFSERQTQNQFTRNLETQQFGEHKREFGITSSRESARDAETARNHRAEEGLRGQEIGAGKAASGAATLRRGQDANKLDADRQKAYQQLDQGDPKTGTPGYNQRLKDLQTAKVNPGTGKAYTSEERAQAIEDLNEEHADAKARIESNHAAGLQNLGISAQPVQYDGNGKPMNNTDGSSPQQLKPPAAAPPAARAAAAPPATQQQQPPAVQPPKGNGKALTDAAIAAQYMQLAGGDKDKARQLAKRDQWLLK